jgi:hypothetical protein
MIWPSQNHLQRQKGNRAKSAFAKYVHVDVIAANIVQVLLLRQLDYQPQVELWHHKLPLPFKDHRSTNPLFPALPSKPVKKNLSPAQ